MNGAGAGLFGPVGLERVTPGMVIDVASLILQGFHAVPRTIQASKYFACSADLLNQTVHPGEA